MKKTLCAALAAMFFVSVLSGCVPPPGPGPRGTPNTAIGATTGVVGGAIVGGIVGGRRGALLGGLLGGLTGGAIGHYYDQMERDYPRTAREYAYSPAEGTRLKIESVRSNPAVLAPGETVNINVVYAVLPTGPDRQVLVSETREILFQGASVGKTSIEITRDGGTWKSTVPVTLPLNAASGNYRVVASVETAGGGKDVDETFFNVRR